MLFCPEHLRLDANGAKAEVLIVEPTGSETLVTPAPGGHDLVGVLRERISAKPGESIGIAFDESQMHLFDPQSGERVLR